MWTTGAISAASSNFCKSVLAQIDEDTIVIPGHGVISDYAGLQRYVDMLQDLRDRIAGMVRRGKSLEEVIAAKPTAAYDEQQGDAGNFVNRAYFSMKRELDK